MVNVRGPVYAVLGLQHPWGVNAGFIVTEEGVVVIDASWTVHSALTILGYARAVAPGKRIKYLVWTEHHSDHIFGSVVFVREGAKVVAHRAAAEFLKEVGGIRGYMKLMRKRVNERYADLLKRGYDVGAVVFEGVEDVWPDVLIEGEHSLELGGVEFRLIPTPGHTPSNLVVFLPQYRVLFAGDTVYSRYPPVTRFATPELIEKWIESLEMLLELDVDVIVPGHGPLCGREEVERNLAELKRIEKTR
ncbi:MAG: hypothetical protein DRK00_09940 [Thermoprotei archaeon]|nr:MAG: hypothetical protein DRK00_09940 [Thermoprotei archaeon]